MHKGIFLRSNFLRSPPNRKFRCALAAKSQLTLPMLRSIRLAPLRRQQLLRPLAQRRSVATIAVGSSLIDGPHLVKVSPYI